MAYTSVSHLGFVVLGVFAWNPWSLSGVVMQMIAHGVSTGGLFVIAGLLQERTHTRDMRHLGGLRSITPRLAAMGLFFAIAALGLPGMGNFVGEFLILLGSYRVNIGLTVAATLGFVGSVVYALALVQKTFHGENTHGWQMPDLSIREMTTLGAMATVTIWLGLYPQPVLDAAAPAINGMRDIAAGQYQTDAE